ncbi:putative amidoligase enzyme-domain-containing protein [Biscogniauxia mediterranea]|nr:putative amidoligase enzyme-domain-containing protein [Biscogniauxia mediterranea]
MNLMTNQARPGSQSQGSMSGSNLVLSLKFGVELETVITGVGPSGSLDPTHYDRAQEEDLWKQSAEQLARSLRRAGVPCHVARSTEKHLEDYTEWCIMEDCSITEDTRNNRFGMEVVSPVLAYADRRNWTQGLQLVFSQLHRHEAATNPSCGTHVHVSLNPSWSLAHLKALASAILYFDGPLTQLCQRAHRQGSHWARPHRGPTNEILRDKSITAGLALVARARTPFEVISVVAPPGAHCREYQWNLWAVTGLTNWGVPPAMVDEEAPRLRTTTPAAAAAARVACQAVRRTGTVEFRMPPGCDAAGQAAVWNGPAADIGLAPDALAKFVVHESGAGTGITEAQKRQLYKFLDFTPARETK